MTMFSPGQSHYPRSHLAVEMFLEQGDVPFTSLRPNIFTPFMGIDYSEAAKTCQFKTLHGGATFAAIDPDDVGK